MNLFRQLYELSPRGWCQKIHSKLSVQNKGMPRIEDILSSSKNMRSQRLYDFLSRYEAIIARQQPWTPIDFKGRNVIEIGTGPAFGWAPLAVFLGCACYTCIEPFCNPDILESSVFIRRYLLYLHKDLTALYGQQMTFEVFLSRLKERINVVREKLLDSDLEGDFEIALSNSCLEHITPLDATIARLKSLSSPDCRFIHVVDFGNHMYSDHPFNEIYTVEPETYFARHGRKINLLRGPDILQIFHKAGFNTSLVPYYYHQDFYSQSPITYWGDRYSNEDLFLKCGIFISSAD